MTQFELTASGRVAGFAAIYNTPDQSGDVILPGAFAKSLARTGAGGVRMLFAHDAKEVVGVWHRFVETPKGLYAEGQLVAGVQRSAELAALLEAKAIDGLSIGFKTKKARTVPKAGLRELIELELWEVSIVTFPMHSGARVSKSQPIMPPRLYEERDDDAHMRQHVLRLSTALRSATHESGLRVLALKARELDGMKYDPNQPREPAGTEIGGRWAGGGVESTKPHQSDDVTGSAPDKNRNLGASLKTLREEADRLKREQIVDGEPNLFGEALCAQYVRTALNEGGWDVKPSGPAKNFGNEMLRVGFKPISIWDGSGILPDTGYLAGYLPIQGDVVIMQPYRGGNPAGHMAMFDGQNWISDFVQRDIWANRRYQTYKPNFIIYRY